MGAVDFFQEQEESTSADKVKRLRQVYEGEEVHFAPGTSPAVISRRNHAMVDLPALNPHWDSGYKRALPRPACSRAKMTLANTLPTMLSREMSR